MSTDVPTEVERLTAASVAAIDAHREKLGSAAHVLKLEKFAARNLENSSPLHHASIKRLSN